MTVRLLALVVALLASSCALFRPRPPSYEPVHLPSGVSYRDLAIPSAGAEVRAGDTISLHYELRLPDRSIVESSRDSGTPLVVEVGGGELPEGLEEGLLGMRLYGRRRIVVPAALAYGEEGRPPHIPPRTALTFEVEVMEHWPAGPSEEVPGG